MINIGTKVAEGPKIKTGIIIRSLGFNLFRVLWDDGSEKIVHKTDIHVIDKEKEKGRAKSWQCS